MSASILPPVDQGHAHEVGLGYTFDFLNTGASAGRLPADPSLDAVLGWFVDRAVIHHEGADRLRAQVAAEPSLATRELIRVRRVREALREVAHSIAEQRGPSASQRRTDDDRSGWPAAKRARTRARSASAERSLASSRARMA